MFYLVICGIIEHGRQSTANRCTAAGDNNFPGVNGEALKSTLKSGSYFVPFMCITLYEWKRI